MSKRRETPLKNIKLEKGHCSIGVRLNKLGMVPFFQELSESDLEKVNQHFRARHFDRGDVIYREEETASLLRIVVAGKVKLVRHTLEGKDVLIDMLQPGEYFGSLPSIGDEKYMETAIAQTQACVLSVGTDDFRNILNQYPSVAVKALEITAGRLKESQEQIKQLRTRSVENRIAHVLTMLSDKFGEESEVGLLIQVPLSRKELADMVGTTAETASRIISRFQEKDWVSTGRQWIAIKNQEKIRDLSQDKG